jgi:ubiquinol-cytochrome c reductase subunit 9
VFVLKSLSCIIFTTKMALARTFYNTFVKKNSVFMTTIFVSAFAFEVAFDTTTSRVWDNLNKGVSARLFSFLCFQFIHLCMQQDDESVSRHISTSNGNILIILGIHLISTRHFI